MKDSLPAGVRDESQATVQLLRQELEQTQQGLLVLTMELEQRVDERTAELRAAHAELQKTNFELLHLTLELEDRVAQRTAELTAANQALLKAQAELEERVRERTAELEAFCYSVSHDLRAPVRSVIGFGRILLENHGPKLDEEGRRLVKVIEHEARRMGQLIDDLLRFSRIGCQPMRAAMVDMTDLARSVFADLAAAEPGRDVRFKLEPLPRVLGDAAMLRQVFVNLLSNALKFTRGQPAPVIEIGGATQPEGNTYFVRDNGAGFDERYAGKLFKLFQRLHGQDEFEGTGVGLALVQRIIQRHGGKVRAKSKLGQGATFYFTLPIEGSKPAE